MCVFQMSSEIRDPKFSSTPRNRAGHGPPGASPVLVVEKVLADHGRVTEITFDRPPRARLRLMIQEIHELYTLVTVTTWNLASKTGGPLVIGQFGPSQPGHVAVPTRNFVVRAVLLQVIRHIGPTNLVLVAQLTGNLHCTDQPPDGNIRGSLEGSLPTNWA